MDDSWENIALSYTEAIMETKIAASGIRMFLL